MNKNLKIILIMFMLFVGSGYYFFLKDDTYIFGDKRQTLPPDYPVTLIVKKISVKEYGPTICTYSPEEAVKLEASLTNMMMDTDLVIKGVIEKNHYKPTFTAEELLTISQVKIEKILWQRDTDVKTDDIIKIEQKGGYCFSLFNNVKTEIVIDDAPFFKEKQAVILFLKKSYQGKEIDFFQATNNRFLYSSDKRIQSENPLFESSKGKSILTLTELEDELLVFKN